MDVRSPEFQLAKLQIKKPFLLSEQKHIFEIKFDNSDLIIQSPPAIIPFKPSIYDDGYGSLIAVYNDTAFLDVLKDIETTTLTRIRNKTKYALLLENREHTSPITENRIRFISPDIKSIQVYDLNKVLVEGGVAGLKKDTKIAAMAHISGMYVRGDRYGLTFKLIQVQILDIPLSSATPCGLIASPADISIYTKMLKMGIPKLAVEQKMRMDGVDPAILTTQSTRVHLVELDQAIVTNTVSSSSQIPNELMVYSKMLKMGIPRPAVEQKMRMDGVDVNMLTILTKAPSAPPPPPPQLPLKSVGGGPPKPPPPPPPPPPPNLAIRSNSLAVSAVLKDIQSGNFTLRKATDRKIEPQSPNLKKTLLLNTSTLGPQKPPSLGEILAARKNLRAIK